MTNGKLTPLAYRQSGILSQRNNRWPKEHSNLEVDQVSWGEGLECYAASRGLAFWSKSGHSSFRLALLSSRNFPPGLPSVDVELLSPRIAAIHSPLCLAYLSAQIRANPLNPEQSSELILKLPEIENRHLPIGVQMMRPHYSAFK